MNNFKSIFLFFCLAFVTQAFPIDPPSGAIMATYDGSSTYVPLDNPFGTTEEYTQSPCGCGAEECLECGIARQSTPQSTCSCGSPTCPGCDDGGYSSGLDTTNSATATCASTALQITPPPVGSRAEIEIDFSVDELVNILERLYLPKFPLVSSRDLVGKTREEQLAINIYIAGAMGQPGKPAQVYEKLNQRYPTPFPSSELNPSDYRGEGDLRALCPPAKTQNFRTLAQGYEALERLNQWKIDNQEDPSPYPGWPSGTSTPAPEAAPRPSRSPLPPLSAQTLAAPAAGGSWYDSAAAAWSAAQNATSLATAGAYSAATNPYGTATALQNAASSYFYSQKTAYDPFNPDDFKPEVGSDAWIAGLPIPPEK